MRITADRLSCCGPVRSVLRLCQGDRRRRATLETGFRPFSV